MQQAVALVRTSVTTHSAKEYPATHFLLALMPQYQSSKLCELAALHQVKNSPSIVAARLVCRRPQRPGGDGRRPEGEDRDRSGRRDDFRREAKRHEREPAGAGVSDKHELPLPPPPPMPALADQAPPADMPPAAPAPVPEGPNMMLSGMLAEETNKVGCMVGCILLDASCPIVKGR